MVKTVPVSIAVATIAALAMLGALSNPSFTATQPAEASARAITRQDMARIDAAGVDVGKLTEPFRTPLQATSAISGGNATINPVDPGVATRLQVVFVVSAALTAGVDQIVLTLDDDFQVLPTLDRNQITISATEVSNPSSFGDFSDFASDTVAPQSVTVDFVGAENDEPEITLLVPDMLTGTDSPALGVQGIASGATVTIVFQQSAGINNSSEANFRSVRVRTTAAGDNIDFRLPNVVVPMRIQLSSDAEFRNESVSLIALGVEGGTNVTFWLDLNGDGIRPNEPGAPPQPGEQDLCSAVAASSDIATCSFTVSNPPFVPGPGDNCTVGTMSNCNFINAKDGDINPRTTNFPLALTQGFVDRQNFELNPTLEISPSTANVGDRVNVSLFDYPPGDTVVAAGITIGGVAATAISPAIVSIQSNGEGNFTLIIPSGVRQGVQKINVATNSGAAQDFNLTLLGPTLAVSHPQVVANQDLTISGSGYTEGVGNCVLERLITLNNIPLRLDRDSLDSACDGILNPGDVGVELTSAGTFTATVQVITTDGTIPSAFLNAGSKELKVIDSNGVEGSTVVAIAERTLNVIPKSAGPEEIITVIGTGFPSSNPDTGPVSVSVEYDCGGANQRTVTAEPDASGNFEAPLRIPTNCGIPSTNSVRATVDFTNTTEAIIHEIPAAVIRMAPSSGPSGSLVTLVGEGFRRFQTVESIEFGGLGVLGGRTINTNAKGNFVAAGLAVPNLSLGTKNVRVEVGTSFANRTSASTTFEVIIPPAAIRVDPWSFNLSLPQGETSDQILSVSNDGEVPLEFDIDVVAVTSSRLGPSSAFGTPDPEDWADTAKELARRREESSSNSPLPLVEIQAIPVINLVRVLDDPEGDASGPPPLVDNVGVDAGFNPDMLTLSATFNAATDMSNLVGYIHLDTDQDPSTGIPPAAQFGTANQDLGADYFLNLFNLPSLGVIGVFDQNSNFITDVVPTVQDQSIRVSIPLSVLGGDDGRVNFSMVLGNDRGATEWAPDSGHAQVGPVEWVTGAPSAGKVAGGDRTVVVATFDATNLGPGIYTANLVIHSNDPVRSTVVVPVTLTVTSGDVVKVQPVVADTILSGSTFLARIEADEVGDLAHALVNLTYDQSLFTFVEAQAGSDFSDCLPIILPGQGQMQLELDCSDGHSGANISLWTLRFEAAVVSENTPTQLTAAGVQLSDSRMVPQSIPSVGDVGLTIISKSTS